MNNWQSVGDILNTDNDIFNTRGCPFCGSINTKHAIPHADVECCQQALQRQITWRSNDIDQLNARIKVNRAAIDELKRQAHDAASRQAKDALEIQIGRAERHHRTRMTEHYEPELKHLSREIGRLNAKLIDLTNAPQRLDLEGP